MFDVVFRNKRAFCFDGFDNAAASTLDILISKKNGVDSKRIERNWCPSRVLSLKKHHLDPEKIWKMNFQHSVKRKIGSEARVRIGKH